jgi:hypothetical protein
MILEGEFLYETSDPSGGGNGGHNKKKSGALRQMDLRKLLFSRKKVTIDDRRKYTEGCGGATVADGDGGKGDKGNNKAELVLRSFKP